MSIQTRGMYLNDYPLDRIGFVIEPGGLSGWRDGLSVRDRTTQLPGRAGEIALARDFETEPRLITITGVQRASSMSQLQSRFRELKQRFYEGTTEIRFVDDPEKVFYARCEKCEPSGIVRELQDPNHRVRIQLKCPDPIMYDRLGTVAGFSAVPAEMPLGTAPSFPLIRISGAVTDPVITYKDFRGDTKKTFGLTIVLGSTEWVEIDMGLSTITDDTGTQQPNAHTSGDFFALDPQDAAGEDGPYPTLEVSPDCSCDILYRKAWL